MDVSLNPSCRKEELKQIRRIRGEEEEQRGEEEAGGAGRRWVEADKKSRSVPLPLAAQTPAGGDRGRGGGAFSGPHCSEMIKNQ